MKHLTLRSLSLDESRLDSPFDPVLSGVAQGLATLFPPVETVRSGDSGHVRTLPAEIGCDDTDGAETTGRS